MVGRWPSGAPLGQVTRSRRSCTSAATTIFCTTGRVTGTASSVRSDRTSAAPTRATPSSRIQARSDRLRSASATESSGADARMGHQWQARWRLRTSWRPATPRGTRTALPLFQHPHRASVRVHPAHLGEQPWIRRPLRGRRSADRRPGQRQGSLAVRSRFKPTPSARA